MPAEGYNVNETVVVITGADAIVPAVAQRIPADAVVIAADGALDHALAAGVTPAGLVGDMDSVSAAGAYRFALTPGAP